VAYYKKLKIKLVEKPTLVTVDDPFVTQWTVVWRPKVALSPEKGESTGTCLMFETN
jgi:hypothetical protein